MAIRRLNFTDRSRLSREQANFRILPGQTDNEPATFESHLDFSDLPKDACDAKVFIEAYQQTTRMRFDFGTVGNLLPPPPLDLTLHEFSDWRDIKFRVRVTDVTNRPGAVLAWANQITPQRPAASEGVDLLRFRDRTLEGPLWDLEYDDDGPIVAVEKLAGGAQAVGRDPHFIAIAYPEILRRTLEQALIADEVGVSDQEHWFHHWHEGYLREALGLREAPDDLSARREWIHEAVNAFGRKFHLAGVWPSSMEEEAS